jgi:tight adherence protein C
MQVEMLAAALAGVFVSTVVWLAVDPHRKLAPRVRPYAAVSRSRLARSYDVGGQAWAGPAFGEGTLRRLFAPMLDAAARWFAQLTGAANDEELAHKLRNAGFYPGIPVEQKVREFRLRSLGQALLFTVATGAVGYLSGSTRSLLLFAVLGLVLGAATARSRLNSALIRRKERIRNELYTMNQLIAMRTRVGGGVVDALRHAVDRGQGAFVDDLREVLRMHAAGTPMTTALRRASSLTAEPEAARTYNVLATAQERGADLGDALLDLSQDLRATRRDDLKKAAVRRRFMLIIPIVVVLAPVLLLFIGAPVPSLLFGSP